MISIYIMIAIVVAGIILWIVEGVKYASSRIGFVFFALSLLAAEIVAIICLAFAGEHVICESNYLKAADAKFKIEYAYNTNMTDKDIISGYTRIVNEYQKNREHISSMSSNAWIGWVYNTKSLEKYPEVKIDEKVLEQFK